MQYFLLLLPESDGPLEALACRLRLPLPGRAPRGQRINVSMYPDRRDSLRVSADAGAQLAYSMLVEERLVRDEFSIKFNTEEVPATAVLGESAHLLFALAVATQLYQVGDRAYPPALAATGKLDDQGRVRAVGGVVRKLEAALLELPKHSLLLYPKDCQQEVEKRPDIIEKAASREVRLRPVATLEEAARLLGIPVTQVWLERPFQRLDAFGLEHQAIFFGRDAETDQLRQRLLAAEKAGTPGALVIGPSGAGKSSLVQAGVLASLVVGPEALRDKPLHWSIWRPGNAAGRDDAALCRSVVSSWQDVPGWKSVEAAGLDAIAPQGSTDPGPSQRTVWIVDQLEELFTLGFGAHAIEAFATLVARLQARGVWVVATLRSEFYGPYAALTPLRKVFAERGIYDLEPIRPEVIVDLIREPARLARLTFEKRDGRDLAQLVLRDVQGNRDSLPLLEYALYELYDQRDTANGLLTLASYDSWGDLGLGGAIVKKAEAAFKTVPFESNKAADDALAALLRALVRVSSVDGTEAAQFADHAQWQDDLRILALIDSLSEANLLTRDGDQSGRRTVRLAHESVRLHWPRARQLLDDSRHELIIRDRLLSQFDGWRLAPSDQRLLAGAGEIADARALIASGRSELLQPPAFRVYLDHSVKAAGAGALRKRQLVITAFVMMAMLAIWAVVGSVSANNQRREAEFASATARETVDRFVDQVADVGLRDYPGLFNVRAEAAHSATLQYQGLLERRPGDESLLLGLANALRAHGNILVESGPYSEGLAKLLAALKTYRAALADKPADDAGRFGLAKALTDAAAAMSNSSRSHEALSFLREAEAFYASPHVTSRVTEDLQVERARVQNWIGNLLLESGKPTDRTEAARAYQAGLQSLSGITAPKRSTEVAYIESVLSSNLANCFRESKNFEHALATMKVAVAGTLRAIDRDPGSRRLQFLLGAQLIDESWLLTEMKAAEPEVAARWQQAVDRNKALIDANPTWVAARISYSQALVGQGYFWEGRRRFDETRHAFDTAMDTLRKQSIDVIDREQLALETLRVLDKLMTLAARRDERTAGRHDTYYEATLQTAIADARVLANRFPGNLNIKGLYAQFLATAADERRSKGKTTEAIAFNWEAVQSYVSNLSAYEQTRLPDCSFHQFGKSLNALIRFPHPDHDGREIASVVRTFGQLWQKTSCTIEASAFTGVMNGYAKERARAGDVQGAMAPLRQLIEIGAPVLRQNPWDYYLRANLAGSQSDLASLFAKLGQTADEIVAWRAWLELVGRPWFNARPRIDVSAANPDHAAVLAELRRLHTEGPRIMRYPILANFNGVMHEYEVLITSVPPESDPLADQARWLLEARGGVIPEETRELFRHWRRVAAERDVSFPPLMVGVLQDRDKDHSPVALSPLSGRSQ